MNYFDMMMDAEDRGGFSLASQLLDDLQDDGVITAAEKEKLYQRLMNLSQVEKLNYWRNFK